MACEYVLNDCGSAMFWLDGLSLFLPPRFVEGQWDEIRLFLMTPLLCTVAIPQGSSSSFVNVSNTLHDLLFCLLLAPFCLAEIGGYMYGAFSAS